MEKSSPIKNLMPIVLWKLISKKYIKEASLSVTKQLQKLIWRKKVHQLYFFRGKTTISNASTGEPHYLR